VHAFRTVPRRILVVSFGPPDFDRNSGSLRFYSLLQILSQQHEVTFYAPRRFYSPTERSDSRGQRYIDALTSLGIDVHFGPPTLLGSLLARTDHSVFFEFFHTAEWALQFTRLHRPDLPIVVDSVDLAYVRQYRRVTYAPHRLTARIIASRTKHRELGIYGRADVVVVVTDNDRRTLLRALPHARVAIVANVHLVKEPVPDFRHRIPHSLLFVGHFEHNPNVDAMLWFCRSILPLIRDRIPDGTLTIVGDSAPPEVRALAGDGVNVAGWVPDLTPYLRSNCVSIAPLRFGSGMKGKIGEAMAAGLPVVTTTFGAEGMNLQHDITALIADSPHEFATAVVRLWTDPSHRAHVARRGLEHVKQNWSVGIVGQRLLEVINSLPSLRPKRATILEHLAARVWLPSSRVSSTLDRLYSVLRWYWSWSSRKS